MGIHWTELIVVAFVALLIFGPKRLPEIGGAVGRTYREFRKSLGEISELATSELAPQSVNFPLQLPRVRRIARTGRCATLPRRAPDH